MLRKLSENAHKRKKLVPTLGTVSLILSIFLLLISVSFNDCQNLTENYDFLRISVPVLISIDLILFLQYVYGTFMIIIFLTFYKGK